jgi:hypothetical protein
LLLGLGLVQQGLTSSTASFRGSTPALLALVISVLSAIFIALNSTPVASMLSCMFRLRAIIAWPQHLKMSSFFYQLEVADDMVSAVHLKFEQVKDRESKLGE